MERWLFLDSGSAPGAENMALDELLLERAERQGGAPVLRLYSFDPPAITIGWHQNASLILDVDALRADGLDCVRRITGGRALLHEGELTYCVVAPAGSVLFDAGAGEAYLRISAAISAALRSLGVDAEVSRGRELTGPKGTAAPCLSSVTRYELVVRGKKIAGSAQRKTSVAFLQHGSILMRSGSERIARYLRASPDALESRITSVSAELGRPVRGEDLSMSIAAAFSGMFDIEWEPLRLSERDEAEIVGRALAKRREALSRIAGEVCPP
ncbi:MAG: lipoate--protein ligase family protein [Candidatus Krumholzibacteriia bacterium]